MKLHPYLKLLLSLTLLLSSAAHAQIQPYSLNPYYWEYRGDPVLLLGGSIHSNLFQVNNLKSHLDEIKASGANYVRNTMSQRTHWNLDGDMMIPYRSVGNGTYDLNKWNNAYWTAFRNMLRWADERDIIVQVEIWDHWDFAGNSWTTNAFRPANNINYTTRQSGLSNTADGTAWKDLQPFFHSVPAVDDNAFLLKYQEAFVRKVLSYTLKHNNVLYTMDNETNTNAAWSEYWSNFVKDEASRAGVQVETSEMWNDKNVKTEKQRRGYDNLHIYSFLDISQNNLNFDQKHWDNLAWVRNYIKNAPRPINHTKIYSAGNTNWGSGDAQQGVERFWRNIIGGAASSRFHRPAYVGIGLNNTAKNCIAAARKLESKIALWETEVRMDLLSSRSSDEAYLTAIPGEKYALYFTKGGSVGLDLRESGGVLFTVSWINIDTGKWGKEEQISGGSIKRVSAPGRGAWATAIVRNDNINRSPIAKNDSASTDQGKAITINVLGNDSDPDGDSFSIQSFDQGSNGAVTRNGNRLTYTPDTNFNGKDSFNYTVSDGEKTATAKVTVTVKNIVTTPPPKPEPAPPTNNPINVDGNAADWSGIKSMATAGGQSLRSLKVSSDKNNLYFLLEGRNIGTNVQLHLNVDNKESTGYQTDSWSRSGVDYLLENGALYRSGSNNSNWSWRSADSSAVVYKRTPSVIEVKIKKSALAGLGKTIKVGALDLNGSWSVVSTLPNSSRAMVTIDVSARQQPSPKPEPTPEPAPPGNNPINVDGNAADWSGIKSMAIAGGQSLRSLKVSSDKNNLYFLLEGRNIGANVQLHLNVDNKSLTGYQTDSWSSSGVDYLLENGSLYRSGSNNSNWSWRSADSSAVVYKRTPSVIEVKIKKSALAGLGKTIKVGALDLNGSWSVVSGLPRPGETMATF